MGDSEVKIIEKANLNEIKNYTRGETIEVDQGFIIENLPTDLIHVKVKRSGKMSNLLGFATKSLKEEANRNILFTGLGQSVSKTTWCAEILRRKFKDCCQITRSNFKKIEEVWEPKVPELTQLKVVREIPYIEILISKDTLDPAIPGYQAPNTDGQLEQRKSRKNLARRKGPKGGGSGEEVGQDSANEESTSQQQQQATNKKSGGPPRRSRRPRRDSKEAPADQPDSNGDSRSSKGKRPPRKPKSQEDASKSGDEKNEAVETPTKADNKVPKPKSPRRDPTKAATKGEETPKPNPTAPPKAAVKEEASFMAAPRMVNSPAGRAEAPK